MASRALLLIPPFLKYLSGPLLGPAILAGAGRDAGHEVDVLDLNIRWIRGRIGFPTVAQTSPWVGDHDRPSAPLRAQQRAFSAEVAGHLPADERSAELDEDPVLTLMFPHREVTAAARSMAGSEPGRWALDQLAGRRRPDVVGVSVLYSGQVLFALAVSIVAKQLWPGVPVVWGGPHVTALRPQIAADPRYGEHVDRFVFGYAEGSFVDLLDALDRGLPWPPTTACAGAGAPPPSRQLDAPSPAFDDLGRYGHGRLTLPAQITRGCCYARCTYCTYPAVEGAFRALTPSLAEPTVALAVERGWAVSFKDSLLTVPRLRELAAMVGGQAPWSACTKLDRRMNPELFAELAAGGCRTLELGLETLSADAQVLIDKHHSADLLTHALDAAASAGVALVVNYITGFPGADPAEERRWLTWLDHAIASRPARAAKLEHNTFQLERLSPMGRDPDAFGIEITASWPWSTVLGWRASMGETRRDSAAAGRAR